MLTKRYKNRNVVALNIFNTFYSYDRLPLAKLENGFPLLAVALYYRWKNSKRRQSYNDVVHVSCYPLLWIIVSVLLISFNTATKQAEYISVLLKLSRIS